MNTAKALRFIAVEGPIGVGKTSLAMRLADTLSAQTLLEMPEENPFLERFYQNPKQSALPTQLFFLFQRMRQLQGLRQQDMFAPLTISDYLMDKDALFARLNLDDDELALYETVYAQTTIQTPQPDLVVYLHAPTTVLMDRIRRRNRRIEAGISKEYLTKLVDAYTQFFHFYVASPLLIVNTAELDLVGNSNHFQQLVERINATRSGRHYFNPQA
ncbi:deoxynucleoside kinase [Permianibacter aggregans]|uniref:Deoxyadenosine/deoxycytidine kinase n=1 Tax=Permianibacter aggregans TaxID=1510150 RepID=A0A4R6UMX2_9GAMM|nr:deoxynucleoside kinase [Permianibacter aggregans]TDQ46515.1 deoxyadenosine/deoxycytidine kinase [Permianibacter aggregans]